MQDHQYIIMPAVHFHANPDPPIGLDREFEEKAAHTGWLSLVKGLQRYADELGMKLDLQHPESVGHTKEDEVLGKQKIRECTKKAVQSR